jgi:hypothetical protein
VEVGERELERPLDETADTQAPCRCVHVRDVEVDQEVVQPERRDRLAQQLEREPVITGRKLELVEADSWSRVDTRR